jgi:MFS family permease
MAIQSPQHSFELESSDGGRNASQLSIQEPVDNVVQTTPPRSPRHQKYLIVLAGFMANFFVFGIGFTYGVFQDFYLSENGPLHGSSVSAVSIIGTLGTCLTYMLTIFNSYLTKYLKIRELMMMGTLILSLGLICASFCHSTWQFALTQGVMFGLGSSITYIPPVVCAPPYFAANRGIAMGIIFSGTGIGGLAMAPLTRWLISAVGWQMALRILGLIAFVCTFPTSFMVKPCETAAISREDGRLLNLRVAKSWKFALQMAGGTLQAAGYLIPLFFMSEYGQTLGFSYSQCANFIGVNNAVNALSKIFLGYWADRVGRLNMLSLCCVLSAICVFGLWLIPSRDTFISFVVLYGVFSGPIIALLPTCVVELFGIQNYQSATQFMYFSRGIGNLLGSPIAGLFVKQLTQPANFRNAIIYNGVLLVANSVCFLAVRGIVGSENNWKLKQ